MDIKFEIVKRDDMPDNQKYVVEVQTHGKRGDAYTVQKVDNVTEGEPTVFRIGGGGRLVITAPDAENEVVFDPAQGAAVRRSSQQNDMGVADDARTGDTRQAMLPDGRVDPDVPSKAERTQAEIAERQRIEDEDRRQAASQAARSQPGIAAQQGAPLGQQHPGQTATRPNVETPQQRLQREASEKAKAQAEAAKRADDEKARLAAQQKANESPKTGSTATQGMSSSADVKRENQ